METFSLEERRNVCNANLKHDIPEQDDFPEPVEDVIEAANQCVEMIPESLQDEIGQNEFSEEMTANKVLAQEFEQQEEEYKVPESENIPEHDSLEEPVISIEEAKKDSSTMTPKELTEEEMVSLKYPILHRELSAKLQYAILGRELDILDALVYQIKQTRLNIDVTEAIALLKKYANQFWIPLLTLLFLIPILNY